MATIHVRHLVTKPGSAGGLPRFFWQPSAGLHAAGFRSQRVPLDWAHHVDLASLQAAAIARAEELNAEADAWRLGQYRAATQPPTPTGQRTLDDLITHYKKHRDWTKLAPATQRGYQQALNRISKWAGDGPVRAIDGALVQKLHAKYAATPAFAGAIVRVLRLVLAHGCRNGYLAPGSNPAQNPALEGAPPSGVVWPQAAVDAIVAAADAMGRPSIGDAVLLNSWMGQREGDVLRMPRSVLRNGTLVLRQSKTGAGVALPIDMVPALKARLQAALARTERLNPQPSTIIVSEDTGLPYRADNFRHVFARVRAKAADLAPAGAKKPQLDRFFEVDYLLPGRDMADPNAFKVMMMDLTFMHLRHTAVTRLAESDCDTQLIAAITGHSLNTIGDILERYMVRTAKMARVAFGKRMEAEGIAAAPAAASTVSGAS